MDRKGRGGRDEKGMEGRNRKRMSEELKEGGIRWGGRDGKGTDGSGYLNECYTFVSIVTAQAVI